MSVRAVVGAALVAAVAGAAGALTGPVEPARPAATRASLPRRAAAPPAPVPEVPSRNIFEYALAPVPPRPSARAWAPPTPAPSTPAVGIPAPAPAVRLVGLVRRGSRLAAALVIAGETVVLGAGESAAGYSVVSVDADAGVLVRGPAGEEVRLPPEGD